MKLYDDIIAGMEALFAGCECRELPVVSADWPDAGKENLIFRQDMAYELGGSDDANYALGATAITETGPSGDRLLLIGGDLPQLRQDTPYARIALVRTEPGILGQGNTLYNAVKKMEYVRYHVNPEGFMTRVSLINHRESARVSRSALEKGLSFSTVGSMMLAEYRKNPAIRGVTLVFVTDPAFPFPELQKLTRRAETVTGAIDHILRAEMTDCSVCSLQKVCEEVEGIRELHFGLTGSSN